MPGCKNITESPFWLAFFNFTVNFGDDIDSGDDIAARNISGCCRMIDRIQLFAQDYVPIISRISISLVENYVQLTLLACSRYIIPRTMTM
jgi:hypothetical protein